VLVARRYLIGGRVQGVGFRYFAYDAAQREGVSGWVRNLHDGRVEVFAEGAADAITRFEERIRNGPSIARVGAFELEEEKPIRASGFEIRPSAL
jgi:acylphosphatase